MNCSALSPSSFYSYSPSASSSMINYLNEINNNNNNHHVYKKSSSPQVDSDFADHTLNSISSLFYLFVFWLKTKTNWIFTKIKTFHGFRRMTVNLLCEPSNAFDFLNYTLLKNFWPARIYLKDSKPVGHHVAHQIATLMQ